MKKITPTTLLLWITTLLVTFAFMLFWAFLERGLELPVIQRGFKSEHYDTRSPEVDVDIDTFFNSIATLPDTSFSISFGGYVTVDNDLVEGLYIQNDMITPPILAGRFFTIEEMRSDKNIIVVGSSFVDDIYLKNDISYINIDNIEFEVIGVMGIDTSSALDLNLWIPLKKAMLIADLTYASYTIDANSHADVSTVLSVIDPIFETDKDFIKRSEEVRTTSQLTSMILEGNTQMDNITKVYLITIINVVIVVLFSALHWVDRKRKTIEVSNVLGFTNVSIFISLLLEYIKIAFSASFLIFVIFLIFSPLFFTYRLEIMNMNTIFYILSIILTIGVFVILIQMFNTLHKRVKKGGVK